MMALSDLTGRLRAWARGSSATAELEPGAMDSATRRAIPPRFLAAAPGSSLAPLRRQIAGQLEIGRDDEESGDGESGDKQAVPGSLLLRDPNISHRHCVISQAADGRCFLRDLSRNGTRLDGRRVLPNMEVEFAVGQTLDLGDGLLFVLEGDCTDVPAGKPRPRIETNAVPNLTFATVVVGDIRDYTVMVRKAPRVELQHSVSCLFERLAAAVAELGGTVKEFPGDAIVAFWEGTASGEQVISACRAAIELDRRAIRLATDASVWSLPDFPLKMDWALATGPVVIDSFGSDSRLGLSMVGEPIVVASRIEKFADDKTGRILTCSTTRRLAAKRTHRTDPDPLGFADLGPMQAKGFDQPDHVFALQVPEE